MWYGEIDNDKIVEVVKPWKEGGGGEVTMMGVVGTATDVDFVGEEAGGVGMAS